MAFNENRFTRTTLAFNSGKITLDDASIVNGPAQFTYASSVDAIATISGANYFAPAVYDLAVGDYIFAAGSDSNLILVVAAVDRSAGTITTSSFTASGSVGTSNIVNNAVTYAKIQEVSASKLLGNPTGGLTEVSEIGLGSGLEFDGTNLSISGTHAGYLSVAITASQFNGMYATPIQLVAAQGANTLIVLDQLQLVMTYAGVAYASGGTAAVQYDSTANGAGVIASTTLIASTFTAAASSTFTFNPGVVVLPFSTTTNKGLYLSNITGAFTTGTSNMVANIWFKIIPTA